MLWLDTSLVVQVEIHKLPLAWKSTMSHSHTLLLLEVRSTTYCMPATLDSGKGYYQQEHTLLLSNTEVAVLILITQQIIEEVIGHIPEPWIYYFATKKLCNTNRIIYIHAL